MAETIAIGFDVDQNQLQSTIDILEKLGQVDSKTAAAFRAESEKTRAALGQGLDKSKAGFSELDQRIKGVGASAKAALAFDKSKDVLKTANSFTSLRQQIKDAVNETTRLSAKYGELDSRTLAAAKNAANLKERFSDVNKQIAALNPEAKFTAFTQLGQVMAGAFQIATGALQAFGVESEEARKIAAKFQGALNIAVGLNSLTGLKDALANVRAALGIASVGAVTLADDTASIADSTKDYNAALTAVKNTKDTAKIATDSLAASQKGLAVANTAEAASAEAATVATKGFTAALLSNPIFIAIAAISALAGAYFLLKEDVEDVNKELKIRAKLEGEVVRATDQERIKVNILINEYENLNTSTERRKEIVTELNRIAPEFFSNIDSEVDKTKELEEAYLRYIEVAKLRAEAQILIGKIAENNAKIAQDEADGIIDNISGVDRFISAITAAFSQGAAASNLLTSGIEAQSEAVATTKKETETYGTILQGVIDKLRQYGKGLDESGSKEDKRTDKLKELSAKEKVINSQRLQEERDLQNKLRQIGINLIDDEFEKRRQQLIFNFDKEIDVYADKLEQKKITLIEFNKVFAKLNEELAANTDQVNLDQINKSASDEKALRERNLSEILKVLDDQNTKLQTEEINGILERLKARQDTLRSQGFSEAVIAMESSRFIEEESKKSNIRILEDDLLTLQKKEAEIKASGGSIVDIEKQIADKSVEINNAKNDAIISSDEAAKEARLEMLSDIIDGFQKASDVFNAIADLTAQLSANRIEQAKAQLDARLEYLDTEDAANKDALDRRNIGERDFKENEKQILKQRKAANDDFRKKEAAEKRKAAIADRAARLFEIAIATAANSAKQPGPLGAFVPYWIALGLLQAGLVLAQPLPSFFKGTKDLKRGNNPIGVDTIPVMAHEGEAIIPTAKNREYKNTVSAVFDGSIPSSVLESFVINYGKPSNTDKSTTVVNLDHKALAREIGAELGYRLRGREETNIANLSELAEILRGNDGRRR